jgi:hypothetical protein
MSSIPNEFMCPISMDLMTDPVIGSDGHTYERTAITEWLAKQNISPLTRQTMTLADIHPNFALRGAIERWRLANEPRPFVAAPLLPDRKTLTATARQNRLTTVLDINTTHTTPMETAVIAILDTSGSMDSSSSNKAKQEGANFSRLDLVKHSMNTLANLFAAEYDIIQSSLGIISFSSAAKLVMPITQMDKVGLVTATTAINSLRSGGSTNIWDGLRVALLQAEVVLARNPNVNVQILLLTDGEPSADLLPPLGIRSTLKRKLDTLKGRVTISTFGFGYNLDCVLLESVCELGNGTYGFIPDCSMVGTVFINWAAKALLTVAHHISVHIPELDLNYSLGDIIVGRPQHLVITDCDCIPDYVEITYDNGLKDTVRVTTTNGSIIEDKALDELINAVEAIKSSKNHTEVLRSPLSSLKDLKARIDALAISNQFLEDMAKDIESAADGEGQLLKACSQKAWWDTWGRNHCISYYRALKLQQCVNFKDKVLQHFASDEFRVLQDKGIDIFSNIPAPVPAILQANSYYLTMAAAGGSIAPNPYVPHATFSMATLVDDAGGCFTGDCEIRMADNSVKQVKDLVNGDKVWGGHKVAAVLYTPLDRMVDMMTFESGLKITPWHPMKMPKNANWVFPNDVGVRRKMFVDGYYNLALKTGHIVELNGYPVVTLGHGFTDNAVITHPYFGTKAVIDDLKRHKSWGTGAKLIMSPSSYVRSSETGLIQKI